MKQTRDGHRWAGCLALGPRWLLYAGEVGPTDPHQHHATQLMAANDPLTVTVGSTTVTSELVIVRADLPHQIIEGSPSATLLFVDGDTPSSRIEPLPPPQAISPLAADPQGWSHRSATLAAESMLSAIGAPATSRPASSAEVDAAIHHLDDDLAVTAADLARRVGLSSSELSRQFSRQVGIPFRSYRRWRRLVLAVECLAKGSNLTDSAHAAGFSDSAHLTRTFRAMFGIAPSELTAASRWLEP